MINISKVEASATPLKTSSWYLLKNQIIFQREKFVSTNIVLPCGLQYQQISIKSNPFTDNPYIINHLNDSAAFNKGYMLETATTATGLRIMSSVLTLT